jgi:signal transduction histidine kinase
MRPRPLRSSWFLDVAVVIAGLLTVGLLVFSTRLTSTTLDRNGTWNQAVGRLKLSLALSDVWLERGVGTGGPAGVRRHVIGNVDAARAQCRVLLGAPARAEVTRLCGGLQSFRALASRRLQDRARRDAAYDVAFRKTLGLADEAQHAIALEVAGRRTTLNRINAGIALLVLLVFAGMAVVVARRAQQLVAHNERLRRLDRLKDNFVAAVSHELRTPLTSTIGFLQTVERPDLELSEDKRTDLVRIARLQAERLARLVDELLFFTDVESGRLRLSYSKVDIAALSADCVRAAESVARERGVSLQLDAEPIPPFRGDRGRLAQLLDNLVSNALKFTPRGGSVEVRAFATNGHALLQVSDTGIGIPAAERAQLFDRFFRTDAAVEQAIPGTGIGLSIVKAIVDAHNGLVTVESEEGRGTTVRVELPLAQSPGPS